jgi:hypothetical protein
MTVLYSAAPHSTYHFGAQTPEQTQVSASPSESGPEEDIRSTCVYRPILVLRAVSYRSLTDCTYSCGHRTQGMGAGWVGQCKLQSLLPPSPRWAPRANRLRSRTSAALRQTWPTTSLSGRRALRETLACHWWSGAGSKADCRAAATRAACWSRYVCGGGSTQHLHSYE